MSEFDGQGPGSPEVGGDEAARPSAGALLRQAREAAGLHIAALAVALKVPVKKLEALESDRLDLLPDAVFVRALASSVCRTLKIDATGVLALLPQTGRPSLGNPRASINTPFRPPSQGPGPSLWSHLSRPAVLAGLLLVLGALVLVFMPAVQHPATVQQAGADGVAVSPGAAAGTVTTQLAAPVQNHSPATADDQPVSPAVVLAELPPAAPALVVPAVTAAVTPVPAPAVLPAEAAALPLAAAGGTIVFVAKGESWVEVTDAKGVVVLRRTLGAGETAGASGALPLAAVVGRADATQVQVRGKPFDLASVARDNVARFEVK